MENFRTTGARKYKESWGGVNTEQIKTLKVGLEWATVPWIGGGGYRVITLGWAQQRLLVKGYIAIKPSITTPIPCLLVSYIRQA